MQDGDSAHKDGVGSGEGVGDGAVRGGIDADDVLQRKPHKFVGAPHPLEVHLRCRRHVRIRRRQPSHGPWSRPRHCQLLRMGCLVHHPGTHASRCYLVYIRACNERYIVHRTYLILNPNFLHMCMGSRRRCARALRPLTRAPLSCVWWPACSASSSALQSSASGLCGPSVGTSGSVLCST